MSHISQIEMEITDLEALKQACNSLGFQFQENQTSYAWYGTWVGRYSLPEGIEQADLGKCNHAIKIPNCVYEVGVVKRDNKYILLWDSWRKGGLEKALGPKAGRLKQAYAVERVRNEAHKRGYRFQERKMDKGLRIILSL